MEPSDTKPSATTIPTDNKTPQKTFKKSQLSVDDTWFQYNTSVIKPCSSGSKCSLSTEETWSAGMTTDSDTSPPECITAMGQILRTGAIESEYGAIGTYELTNGLKRWLVPIGEAESYVVFESEEDALQALRVYKYQAEVVAMNRDGLHGVDYFVENTAATIEMRRGRGLWNHERNRGRTRKMCKSCEGRLAECSRRSTL